MSTSVTVNGMDTHACILRVYVPATANDKHLKYKYLNFLRTHVKISGGEARTVYKVCKLKVLYINNDFKLS